MVRRGRGERDVINAHTFPWRRPREASSLSYTGVELKVEELYRKIDTVVVESVALSVCTSI